MTISRILTPCPLSGNPKNLADLTQRCGGQFKVHRHAGGVEGRCCFGQRDRRFVPLAAHVAEHDLFGRGAAFFANIDEQLRRIGVGQMVPAVVFVEFCLIIYFKSATN